MSADSSSVEELELVQPGFERLKSDWAHGVATNLDTRTISLWFHSFSKFPTVLVISPPLQSQHMLPEEQHHHSLRSTTPNTQLVLIQLEDFNNLNNLNNCLNSN